ncbi:hypothetical protein LCGC14_0371160 [marine sediment metagenome]|uniref:Chromosomal replication initiator DnaA C-terminal domain-containing protein n=1 Tax=marine sediment metagenome TaxID=412755 RepID=A0A0F9T5E0_9ZZZZ|nr:helix-turn-helix domain-containing protein [Maribacter sp.]HDZ04872.1 hypothetical protein [Maribacter sp.]HEA80841.1 hypothetical protein [Maribacter sp.]
MNYFAIPGFTRSFNIYTDNEKFDVLMKNISKVFDVDKEHIIGKVRRREYVEPRHCLIFMACSLTSLSLEYIGVKVGGRDHSTIIHSRENFYNLCLTNINIRNSLKKVCKLVNVRFDKVFYGKPIADIKTHKFKILNLVASQGPKGSIEIMDKLDFQEETNIHSRLFNLKRDGFIKMIGTISSHDPPKFDITAKGYQYLNRCT